MATPEKGVEGYCIGLNKAVIPKLGAALPLWAERVLQGVTRAFLQKAPVSVRAVF